MSHYFFSLKKFDTKFPRFRHNIYTKNLKITLKCSILKYFLNNVTKINFKLFLYYLYFISITWIITCKHFNVTLTHCGYQ